MAHRDFQGLHVTVSDKLSATDAASFVKSINEYQEQVFRFGNKWSIIQTALRLQPTSALALVLNCDFELARENVPAARESLAKARKLGGDSANERELLIVSAFEHWLSGDRAAAQQAFGKIRAKWPADLFARKREQLLAFIRGDFEGMITAMQDGDGDQSLFKDRPFYHGMLSFALEQNGRFAEAEAMGRRGCELEPSDAWSHHGVAHALIAAGRLTDGIKWMHSQSHHWTRCMSFMYTHNWWHQALFYLEAGDLRAALDLFDTRVWPKPATAAGDSKAGDAKAAATSEAEAAASHVFPLNDRRSSEDQLGALGLLWRIDLRLAALRRQGPAATAASVAAAPAAVSGLEVKSGSAAASSKSAPVAAAASALPSSEEMRARWSDVLSCIPLPMAHPMGLFAACAVQGLCAISDLERAKQQVDVLRPKHDEGTAAATAGEGKHKDESKADSKAHAQRHATAALVCEAVLSLHAGQAKHAHALLRPFMARVLSPKPAFAAAAGKDGGKPAAVTVADYPLQPALGGSHEQRGVVDEFFAEACSAAGEWSDCAAVVAFFVEHEGKHRSPHFFGLLSRAHAVLAAMATARRRQLEDTYEELQAELLDTKSAAATESKA